MPSLVRTVRRRGFDAVDLLYIDTPTQVFWLDAIKHEASVARVGDRYSGFSGIPDELLTMEREMVTGVDLVIFSARTLEQEIVSAGAKRTLHVPNGVDFAHFANGDSTRPPEYSSIKGPIAVYVGEMADWFDYPTIDALANRMPTVSFVLIGPDGLARQRLAQRANVHILGRRPFDRVPSYLHNADVALIPFDVLGSPNLVHAVHPLKLYEYMACGLPVVATRWDELERLDSPAVLCDSTEDFKFGIEQAIAGAVDVNEGIRFARDADWSGRLNLLLRGLRADR